MRHPAIAGDLRARMAAIEGSGASRAHPYLRVATIDKHLPGGGLTGPALHEVARSMELCDDAARDRPPGRYPRPVRRTDLVMPAELRFRDQCPKADRQLSTHGAIDATLADGGFRDCAPRCRMAGMGRVADQSSTHAAFPSLTFRCVALGSRATHTNDAYKSRVRDREKLAVSRRSWFSVSPPVGVTIL